MKFTIALAAVLVAGLTASLAFAAPATKPAKNTDTTTTTTTTATTTTTTTAKKTKVVCRPNVSLILRGNLTTVAADQLSFTMDVKKVNRHAKALKGKNVMVQVNAQTKIRRLGKPVTLGALVLGDRLDVQARVCKVKKGPEVVADAPPIAKRVIAKPAKPVPTTTTTS